MRGTVSLVGGSAPTTPVIGTATAFNGGASVAFTASTYTGKGTVQYIAVASPGGLTGIGTSSPITVPGLTNGTTYTFTVKAATGYGIESPASSASNAVTPTAPAPPTPPAPPPCSCASNIPGGCGFVGYTCDGQMRYDYYDCGCSQTCPGTGGYNGQYIVGFCGYTGPVSCGNCGDGGCGSVRCGPENWKYVCKDGCGNVCSETGCIQGLQFE